jgi:hypothetical protein
LSVVLFVVLKLETQFAKEEKDKEDNVKDEMKNTPEKKKQFVKLYNALVVCF